MKADSYRYIASLPERTVRTASGLTGGLLKGLFQVALPAPVREGALYRATAGIGLRFLIQRVGDVRGVYPQRDQLSRKFALRYAAGSSIEMAGILTVFLSPVWVLAALGDVTRAGKAVFSEIRDALKAEGLLEPDAQFETMEQMLDCLERSSTHLALTVNMPPLDIPGLRREWEQFRANLAAFPPVRLPSPADVERAWNDLEDTARKTNRSVFSVSTAMAVSALSSVPAHLGWLSRSTVTAARTTGMVVGGVLLDHYAAASKEMQATGFATYWARHSRPYMVAAVRHFLPERKSWTERLLRGF